MKKSILDFRAMVERGEKIVWLTGYDYLTAKYEERAGVDMILVGDSLAAGRAGYVRHRRYAVYVLSNF